MPRADAGTLLLRALVADAARHGLAVTVRDWRAHPWASATFVGVRHIATLGVTGDKVGWLHALAEADLPLRGHLVADLRVTVRDDGAVMLEALTIDSA